MSVKAKVNGARKAWVPAVVALIGLGGYLGFSSEQVADLQSYIPEVAAFVVIIGQGIVTYATGNKT